MARDIVSTSYEAGHCQAPVDLNPFEHTIVEAAEQALPNSRARAGGRVINSFAAVSVFNLFELVASWS
jgi:hypothetical protein